MNSVYRMYSDKMFEGLSRNYGRGRYVADSEQMRGDICAFKLKIVTMFFAFLHIWTIKAIVPRFDSSDRKCLEV